MKRHAIVALLFLFFTATPLYAQTTPDLLVEDFKEDPHWIDSTDEPTWIDGGKESRSGENIDLFFWDSSGRIKFDREDPDPNLWFGYRFLTLDIDTDVPDFPQQLNDVSIVSAFKLGEDDDWRITAYGGGGSSNDAHWDNDSLYGIGNINFERKVSENVSWHFGLNFDGNRTFYPDVPLPYVQFVRKVDEDFGFAVGTPLNGFIWRPVRPLVLSAIHTLPNNFDIRTDFYLHENFNVFAEYKKTTDGFYLHDLEHRRLFYDWERISTGVRLQTEWFDARVGLGYAFDQEFSTGWDWRDTDTIAEPDDGPIFFITIGGTF